jgi:modification methylase
MTGEALAPMPTKRAEPRVAFSSLVESGLVRAGEILIDAGGRHRALIRADGSVAAGPAVGSIHKIGALVQGLPACNGWTFWHVERAGQRIVIDDFRANVRAQMRDAAE